MTFGKLYLFFVVLPNLGVATIFLCFIFGIAAFFATACHIGNVSSCSYDKEAVKLLPYSKFYMALTIPCFLFVMALSVFAPSKEQLWMVAGGYAATNDAELKKLPDNVFRAANDYLEKLHGAIEGKTDDGKKK